MKRPDIPNNEEDRLKALFNYNILDSFPEEQYDDITEIASSICNTPISLIGLIDKDRQWFKSNKGIEAKEIPREISICAHAINNPLEVMIINDAHHDDRVSDNPLVLGPSKLQFYAGAPLISPDGFALGTLCVIDRKPKEITSQQIESLKALARHVVALFELKRKNQLLKDTTIELQKTNELLSNFAHAASHDLKAPLNGIKQITTLLLDHYQDSIKEEGGDLIKLLKERTDKMETLIDRILEYSKSSNLLNQKKEDVNIYHLIDELKQDSDLEPGIEIEVEPEIPNIKIHKIALQQILSNLIFNAIKYNDKEIVRINIDCDSRKYFYVFKVMDNGPGIPEKLQGKIFEPFVTAGATDKYNKKGSGMGLAIVKKLVELMDGKIKLTSTEREGSEFNFSIHK